MTFAIRVFLSHSREDIAFCGPVVEAFREARLDVWFDVDDLQAGPLSPPIQRAIASSQFVVVALSPAALESSWVKREYQWARRLAQQDPAREIIPVVAAPLASEGALWQSLRDYVRIESSPFQPYPPEEAARRLIEAITYKVTSGGTINELNRARWLRAMGKPQQAHATLQRIHSRIPETALDWKEWSDAFLIESKYSEALYGYQKALALNPKFVEAWYHKGRALTELGRHQRSLSAFKRTRALDPEHEWAVRGQIEALHAVGDLAAAMRLKRETFGFWE